MEKTTEIFGCFVSAAQPSLDESQENKDLALEQSRSFRKYIWGEPGICENLKKLNRDDYGKDLRLVLFQFFVNPRPATQQQFESIEVYDKREKAVAMPIAITSANFFDKSEELRYSFLKESILEKMKPLSEIVRLKKLDTKIEQLKIDLQKILY
jgi:hypothetical protein